jgi:hypothetical protein
MSGKGKSGKPVPYKVFWICVLLFLGIILWMKLPPAFFSFYVFFDEFSKVGFQVFSKAYQDQLLLRSEALPYLFSWKSILSLIYLLFLYVFTLFFSVFILAQFVLPVQNMGERRKANKSFWKFLFGRHGLAVFVKEGKIIEGQDDSKDASGGVVLVDLSSAVALSQQTNTKSWNIADGLEDEDYAAEKEYHWLGRGKNREPFVDVKGPGLTFLAKGQQIFSAIDLRPQSRSTAVIAYTRNGIQISANVSVTFSLSADAEIINVGYVGGKIQMLEVDESPSEGVMTVRGIFELDEQDASSLEGFALHAAGNYSSPEESLSSLSTPFKYYHGRVFNAASSEAQSISASQTISWREVPLEVATDLFRKELLAIPYEDIFGGTKLPKSDLSYAPQQNVDVLKKMRDSFGKKMKLKGMVLFQYFERKDRKSFRIGETLKMNQVIKYAPITLQHHNFNSLRSLGVVIKAAGISNIQPVSPNIKKRMLENWKARWDKEVEFINAEHDLEAMRIQNRTRAQIQQEMTHLLSGIFQSAHTDEALALRVFQALEAVAVNPKEKNEMTPREIIDMLDSLHRWLLVDRKDLNDESGEKSEDGKNEKKK